MQNVFIYYVPKERLLVDSTGYTIDTDKYPATAITVNSLLCVTLFDASQGTTAYTGFTGMTTFEASFDVNFEHSTLIDVADGDINQVGDWGDLDVANGKLSVRMDFDDADVISEIGTDELLDTGEVEIRGYDGSSNLIGWIRFPLYLWNLQGYTP